jgi:hypothetical protein
LEQGNPIYLSSIEGPLRQGEILSNVMLLSPEPGTPLSSQGNIKTIVTTHEFAIILSQDCDLDQDYRRREKIATEDDDSSKAQALRKKLLGHVLLCGVELASRQKASNEEGRTIWERIVKNNDFRFHYLQEIESSSDTLEKGIGAVIVSFHRYFTVPTEDLLARIKSSETRRRSFMTSPYFEHLSDRFSHYQARVALPKDHSA